MIESTWYNVCMARIEAKGGIQLTLPESSSAVVFVTSGNKLLRRDLTPNYPRSPLISSEAILSAAQGFLERGPEDANNDGKVSQFHTEAAALPADYEMPRLQSDIRRTLKEALPEPSHIGESATILEGVVNFLAMEVLKEREIQELKKAS